MALIGSPLVTRRGDRPRFAGEELVVVSTQQMIPHKLGKGYSSPFGKVVKEVNGTRIKNLRHLVETLRDCKEKFVAISFDDRGSETIVFDRQEAEDAIEDLLAEAGARRQSSADLAPLLEKK